MQLQQFQLSQVVACTQDKVVANALHTLSMQDFWSQLKKAQNSFKLKKCKLSWSAYR